MQVNKAMILAAGYGKRMLPLTENTPKPLIQIGMKSLLERSIEILIKLGVNDIRINIFYLADKIESFIKEKNYSIPIKLIREQELLDTGGGIYNATKDFNKDPFYVLNPDTIWNRSYYEELKILENLYFSKNNPVLLLVNKKNSHDKSFKGDFNLGPNQLITREANNQFIFTGAQIINRNIFHSISSKIFSMNEVWNKLIADQKLFGIESNQTFLHLNNLNVYEDLKKNKLID